MYAYVCMCLYIHPYVCVLYICVYIYMCVHMCIYMCVYVCVCMHTSPYVPLSSSRKAFFLSYSKETTPGSHESCLLTTSRSTYVKPVFTYFDLQNHNSFPMVPHLTRQRPLCGILTGRRVGGRAQARLSGGRQALHCRSGLIFSTFSRHTKGQRKQL